MTRGRLWSLLTVGLAIFSLGFGSAPASAAPSPVPALSSATLQVPAFKDMRRLMLPGVQGSRSQPRRAAQPLVACTAAWRVVDSQSGTWHNILTGTSAITPTDIWTVGFSQDPVTRHDQNLTEHWDGMAWSTVPVPDPGNGGNALNDVAAVSTSDVWAVGTLISNGSQGGATYHWNGTSWSSVTSAVSVSLNDIAAVSSSDVWAVGDDLSPSNTLVTDIQHWTGSAWSTVTSPNVGAGDNALNGVWAVSATDIWAVGYSFATTTSTSSQTLIEHWNGSAWSVVASPNFSSDVLTSVAGASGTDAWAVGYATGSNGLAVGIVVHWNGTAWTEGGVGEPSVFSETIADIIYSSPNYWAVGYDSGNGSAPGPPEPFVLEQTGSGWLTSGQNGFPAPAVNGAGPNGFFAVSAPAAGDVWAVGSYLTPPGVLKNLVENYSGLAAPTSVLAGPTDQAVTVSWTLPCSDGGSAITAYVVTAYDGCTIQGSISVVGAPPATTTSFTGLTNGTAFSFKVAAVNGFGVGPQSAGSAAVTPTGSTNPVWVTACSPKQYTLIGNNGSTWIAMDATNLGVTFTPAVDSFAVLSGNADLWTEDAGYNQDIGVALSGGAFPTVAGQPEGWKESGGFAGTFSPNAAFVQTVVPVVHGVAYTASLVWKANKSDAGTIVAGAGPIATSFSPTRLTVQLVASTQALKKATAVQYSLTGSDGSTWVDMDSTNLAIQFTTPATGTYTAFVSGNVDLWTASVGFNQDIGVSMSGGAFPTVANQPEAWKESGGFAGTFSPNAAFVQVPLALAASTTYTAKLKWKVNRPDSGSIFAGAGPIATHFSPTALTVILVPSPAGSVVAHSTVQYTQPNSDGIYWQALDMSALKLTVAPAAATSFAISVNSDLWTSVAGYNQDIGLMVSGGAYGPGTLVAWKESGGFAGTFSPNAAFVATDLHLQGGVTYTVWAVWKANNVAAVSNLIAAGAGPIGGLFSPTWLTAVQLS